MTYEETKELIAWVMDNHLHASIDIEAGNPTAVTEVPSISMNLYKCDVVALKNLPIIPTASVLFNAIQDEDENIPAHIYMNWR